MLAHTKKKYVRLKRLIKRLGSVVIAFSAGVDSTLLLKVSHDILGDNAVAITALSPTYPAREREDARRLAKMIGARLQFVKTNELKNKHFVSNAPDRCFFCKAELFMLVQKEAVKLHLRHIAYGANADDRKDFRPGMRAAEQAHAVAPLLEAGLSKREIREISRELGLKTWNKPSYACLASRIPYGTRITLQVLNKVEAGETMLHSLGFRQYRLRYHNTLARIEVLPDDFHLFFKHDIRTKIIGHLRQAGFKYITVDLEGYRAGSMNPAKKPEGNPLH